MSTNKLDLIFGAIADTTRRDLLTRLLASDITIGELAAHYDISLPAISKHLSVLERAGLVSITKSGRNKIVSLEFKALSEAQLWLETLGGQSLDWDGLEDEIEKLSPKPY